MASVQKYEIASGIRWRVRYRTPDGRSTMKRGFSTKREALSWAAENTVSMDRGTYIAPSAGRTTFAHVSRDWLMGKVNLKPRTRAGYQHSLDSRVLPQWGHRAVSAITHAEVQKWIADMSAGGLAPNSVRIHFNVAHAVLKYAVKVKAIPANPAEDVNLPRGQQKRRRYLTHAQVEELAQKCERASTDGAAIVYVLAYTGVRWGELSALRASTVDTQRRRLEIDRSVARVGGELHFTAPKNGEARTVAFPAFLSPIITARADRLAPDDLLFSSAKGTPLSGHNFRARVFRPAIEACRQADPSFPLITVHDLRHTAASLAISSGANVKVLQRMLGHASAAMTLDVYADLFDEDLDAVADRMDAARRAV